MISLTRLSTENNNPKIVRTPIEVNMYWVMNMQSNRLTISAPTQVDSLVYRDGVPKERYVKLDSADCTTLMFADGSTVDVEESIVQIKQMVKEDKED